MLKNLFKAQVLVLVALTALGVAAFSTVSAEGPQALATVTETPTFVPTPATTPAPTDQLPTRPRAALQAALNNPLALLRRLGLVGGNVVANNGNSLSLRLGQTTRELQIASTTLLVVPGTNNAQTSDIQIGDRVVAKVPNRDPNAAPSLVLDLPKGYTADNVMAGLVQLNAGGSVSLRTRRGQQVIAPTASTVILGVFGGPPALRTERDIRRGDVAIVIGQKSGDQLEPQVIVVLDRTALQGIRKQNQPLPTPTP